MKKAELLIALIILLLTSLQVFSQTNVTTSGGTTGCIPKFTGSTTVGNSVLYESSSKIGIGTSTPSEYLELYGGTKNLLFNNTDESEAGIIFKDQQDVSGLQIAKILFNSNTSADNTLKFYVASSTPRMTIAYNGNIGIGESAPNEKLEVNGNISLTGNIMGYRSTGSYSLAANTSYTDGGTVILYGNSEASTPGQLKLIASGATGDIEFATNSSARMRILDNGNVGIGTTTPAELLTVNGKILAEEVEVVADIDNYPDFVFAEDYKLLTIKELEEYLIKYNHLPNVPSVTDVEKDGINLGEMSTILLQKIEELTLYVIELKKENEEIKEKLQKIKD